MTMTEPDDVVAGLSAPLKSCSAFGPISSAVAARMWLPDPTEPVLAEWWLPLATLSRRLRQELFHWPVNLDEYDLIGRIDREPRPRVWIYRHHRGPCELAVDDDGRTYRFIWAKGRRSLGRLAEIGNRSAMFRACLTDLIEPITYRDELYEAQMAGWDQEDQDGQSGA
jgi:hypothetical protein